MSQTSDSSRPLYDSNESLSYDTSPRKPTAFNMGVHTDANSSRVTMNHLLEGKVYRDNNNVLAIIQASSVPANIVELCSHSLKQERNREIDLLVKCAAGDAAFARNLEKVEKLLIEESGGKVADESGQRHATLHEKDMYDPLIKILNFIAQFNTNGAFKAQRLFAEQQATMKATTPRQQFGFPSFKPDLTAYPCGVDPNKLVEWCNRDFFGEVKPSNNQGVRGSKDATITTIVSQSADYARVFLSSRPMFLYCVGLLIFGTKFCVGIFDRDGVTFSPEFDMFNDLNQFVRVVFALTRICSLKDLGLDPTVSLLDSDMTLKLVGQETILPTCIFNAVGNDKRKWCSIGDPQWTSLSLFGRGTCVWRVKECIISGNGISLPRLVGEVHMLKTSWRHSGRNSETSIYQSLSSISTGVLAKFICGGDVFFLGVGFPITVQNLRYPSSMVNLEDSSATSVLHRIVLSTVGKPIWEFETELELLMGIRDAIEGHRDLHKQGILHRDISAGNVMLYPKDTGVVGRTGFLADLDMVRIAQDTIERMSPEVKKVYYEQQSVTNDQGKPIPGREVDAGTRTHIRYNTQTEHVQRGAPFTGTAQFMARVLLRPKASELPVRHDVCHDLESFIWVTSYAMLRNLLYKVGSSKDDSIKSERPALTAIFNSAFARQKIEDIAIVRTASSDAIEFTDNSTIKSIINTFVSETITTLFLELGWLVQQTELKKISARKPITYESILEVFEQGIRTLKDHEHTM